MNNPIRNSIACKGFYNSRLPDNISKIVREDFFPYESTCTNPATFTNSPSSYSRGSNDGFDLGMFDIPYLSGFYKPLDNLVRVFLESKLNSLIIKSFSSISNRNPKLSIRVYIYNSVQSPRPAHFDSSRFSLKLFIPLSASVDSRHGPYSFYPYTYLFSRILFFLSKFLLLPDTGFKSRHLPFPKLFCPKIFYVSTTPVYYITRQDAYHGDTPAKLGQNRAALVFYYH